MFQVFRYCAVFDEVRSVGVFFTDALKAMIYCNAKTDADTDGSIYYCEEVKL